MHRDYSVMDKRYFALDHDGWVKVFQVAIGSSLASDKEFGAQLWKVPNGLITEVAHFWCVCGSIYGTDLIPQTEKTGVILYIFMSGVFSPLYLSPAFGAAFAFHLTYFI